MHTITHTYLNQWKQCNDKPLKKIQVSNEDVEARAVTSDLGQIYNRYSIKDHVRSIKMQRHVTIRFNPQFLGFNRQIKQHKPTKNALEKEHFL